MRLFKVDIEMQFLVTNIHINPRLTIKGSFFFFFHMAILDTSFNVHVF